MQPTPLHAQPAKLDRQRICGHWQMSARSCPKRETHHQVSTIPHGPVALSQGNCFLGHLPVPPRNGCLFAYSGPRRTAATAWMASPLVYCTITDALVSDALGHPCACGAGHFATAGALRHPGVEKLSCMWSGKTASLAAALDAEVPQPMKAEYAQSLPENVDLQPDYAPEEAA